MVGGERGGGKGGGGVSSSHWIYTAVQVEMPRYWTIAGQCRPRPVCPCVQYREIQHIHSTLLTEKNKKQ